MLRCIKWLPYACLGLFAVFAWFGYELPQHKSKPTPLATILPPPVQLVTVVFRVYDVNGGDIPAYAETGKGVPLGRLPQKLTRFPGESETIIVTPGDSGRFMRRTVQVKWLKPDKDKYKALLNNTFLDGHLAGVGHNASDTLTETLRILSASVNDNSYDYPIVLKRK